LQNHVFTLHEYVKEAGEVRDPYGGTKEMYVHTYEELVSLILKFVPPYGSLTSPASFTYSCNVKT
jgi:protein-tyrosine-phosphatase